jgi:hypothetical protein
MRPHRVGMGPPRYREDDGRSHVSLADVGRLHVGREVFPGAPAGAPSPRNHAPDAASVASSVVSFARPPPSHRSAPRRAPMAAGDDDDDARSRLSAVSGLSRVDEAALGPVYVPSHDAADAATYDGGASWRDDASLWSGREANDEPTASTTPRARPMSARGAGPSAVPISYGYSGGGALGSGESDKPRPGLGGALGPSTRRAPPPPPGHARLAPSFSPAGGRPMTPQEAFAHATERLLGHGRGGVRFRAQSARGPGAHKHW